MRWPARTQGSNKTHGGRVAVWGGGPQFLGAGVLAARGAARSGAGYTYLFSPVAVNRRLRHPDFIFRTPSEFRRESAKMNGVLIGPGAGLAAATTNTLRFLLKAKMEAVVVDADALTCLAKMKNPPVPPSWILTPHGGELSRLIDRSVSWINKNRKRAAREAVAKFGCVVVLKGHQTLVAHPKGIWVNTTGNPSLAKSGTGDVLGGMMTAFRAQGLSPVDAAKAAVFVHGMAADLWVKRGRDPLSLLASDLVELLPQALTRSRKFRTV